MAVPSLRHNCANATRLLCHSIGSIVRTLKLCKVSMPDGVSLESVVQMGNTVLKNIYRRMSFI